MAKYCIYCDRPILDGKPCPCRHLRQQDSTKRTTSAQKGGNQPPFRNEEKQKAPDKRQTATGAYTTKQTWNNLILQVKTAWRKFRLTEKVQIFWQNLTEFVYHPTKITLQPDQLKPGSPLLFLSVQVILVYLWAINFLQNTNLGHFLRYTEKTYLESDQNFTSRIAGHIVFILVMLHLTKLFFTYIGLRIQHYHVRWKQVLMLELPANIVATLSILISFLFLYGSGFISLGILLFSCMAACSLDYLTVKNNFNFTPDRALLFTWILYLLTAITVAAAVELIFPHISSFYMNTGIRF